MHCTHAIEANIDQSPAVSRPAPRHPRTLPSQPMIQRVIDGFFGVGALGILLGTTYLAIELIVRALTI